MSATNNNYYAAKQQEKERNMEQETKGIMEMARGGFLERVDHEMVGIIANILDPNTKATAPRKVNITLTLTPDDQRQNVAVKFEAKSVPAPTTPLTTSLYVAGESVVEMVPTPQLGFDGFGQEVPYILKIAK